jgi:hypothetical protein
MTQEPYGNKKPQLKTQSNLKSGQTRYAQTVYFSGFSFLSAA